MKQTCIVLAFFFMMNSQNASAVEVNCQEKLRICKGLWQKLETDKTACEECLMKCSDAQKTCKDEMPNNQVTANNNLVTANTYLLGCKQACKGVSIPPKPQQKKKSPIPD